MKAELPEVLIVGRPNVGKSTLFNRLAGKSLALVDNQPGSTRDLKSFDVEWDGTGFTVTDSGGWVPGEKESIALKVGAMLEGKLQRVAALILVVDGQEGLTPADGLIARAVRKYGIPTWLAVNKADRPEKAGEMAAEFTKLGFENCTALSAMHGIGLDELLDSLVEAIRKKAVRPPAPEGEGKRPLRLAILGKPNVGKSSMVNAILGEKRVLVDDLPGTTHDAIPVIIETAENPLVVVDTAGIRSNLKQDSRIEKLSVEQSLYELQTCQVALFVVDGEKGITHQDVTLSRIIAQAFRPVVIIINKWDIHPTGAEQARAERIARRELRLIHYAPVLFVSAKTGLNLERVLPAVYGVYEESCRQVPTRRVNLALQAAVGKASPPFKGGHQLKILYGYQRVGHPPVFEVIANQRESATPSYLRYLEAELREALDMPSTPLQIFLKEKSDKKEYKKHGFKRNFDPRMHRIRKNATQSQNRKKP